MGDIDYDRILDTIGKGIQEAAKQGRFKHDVATPISPSTNLMHGPNGIFGYPGIERDVFATRVKPRGLLSVLPARGTTMETPIVGYLTGFRDDEAGEEKSGVCDDPLAAGEMKSCLQGALFGRVERKTDQLELNALGRANTRGEMFDLRLVNDPLLEGELLSMPNVPQDLQRALNNEVLARWMTLGVAFERKLGPLVYTGSPANNTVGGGYKEYHGLETLVGTGKIDVITGTACAALDSDVRNFAYGRVDTAADTLYSMFVSVFRNLEDIASRTGLDPVQWIIVMRRNLFDEIVDVWPASYATYRFLGANTFDGDVTRLTVDAMAQVQMIEEMRRGRYLKLDGMNIPVVIDDFLPEDSNTTNANVTSGCFSSDIYILPMSVRGGILSTFFEYFDFSAMGAAMSQAALGRVSTEFWTDGGRWLWTTNRTLWCLEWIAKIEPRLRLLTPHLAGRIQNVQYCVVKHFRDDDPANAYFADGGDYGVKAGSVPYTSADFPAAG